MICFKLYIKGIKHFTNFQTMYKYSQNMMHFHQKPSYTNILTKRHYKAPFQFCLVSHILWNFKLYVLVYRKLEQQCILEIPMLGTRSGSEILSPKIYSNIQFNLWFGWNYQWICIILEIITITDQLKCAYQWFYLQT